MISVAVKVETACGACRMPMPVNTLAREVRCPSCGRPTAVGDDLWKALLRDPLYNGPRLLANEVRRSSAGKLSAAYMRRGPRCQGCDSEIPVDRVREVREQATLRCERCAVQTWVRAVPAELAGALPNVTHLVGEDPDPTAMAPAGSAEAATFPCPQCGSPVPFDGVTRACTCRFCSASVHVPDEFVYRGRRKLPASWFLCFHPSILGGAPVAQAVAAGLFDWEELPEAAVDEGGNLYCAATQSHWIYTQNGDVTEKIDHVLWSIDPSLNIRWIQRERSGAARSIHFVRGALLVISADRSLLWLSPGTGMPAESAGAPAAMVDTDLLNCPIMTCGRDGSLLFQDDGKLRRIAPSGAEVPVWGSRSPARDADDNFGMGLRSLPDRPVNVWVSAKDIYCGPDGSLYLLDHHDLARFDADGRKIYCVDLPDDPPDRERGVLGADRSGNAFVLRRSKLLRVGPAGQLRVVLQAQRDTLPLSKLKIAVCPDGAFWLFGKAGIAWKFDAGGRLLFASEKEPRPRKPTMEELVERRAAASAAAFKAQMDAMMEEQWRAEHEAIQREIAEKNRSQVLGCVLVVVVLLAFFTFFAWAESRH